jgi:hypothetical protein
MGQCLSTPAQMAEARAAQLAHMHDSGLQRQASARSRWPSRKEASGQARALQSTHRTSEEEEEPSSHHAPNAEVVAQNPAVERAVETEDGGIFLNVLRGDTTHRDPSSLLMQASHVKVQANAYSWKFRGHHHSHRTTPFTPVYPVGGDVPPPPPRSPLFFAR